MDPYHPGGAPMKTRATIQQHSSGFAVTGITIHNGQTFAAGGGYCDDHYLYCYPELTHVTTWAGPIPGATILRRTRYEQWNPLTRRLERRICWRIRLADGRIYSGRNGGPGMLLQARRVKA